MDDTVSDRFREYFGRFLSEHKFVFCTNAYNYCTDKSGKELYGIIPLISIFNTLPSFGLIIADPSGAYNEYISNNKINLGSNIKIQIDNKFPLLTLSRFHIV